ncbi:MAG: PEP-CTERM sorting domain-containing protein [bacterium]|nr:PEP-CTERM sorting domain-containing protein [bacterium]
MTRVQINAELRGKAVGVSADGSVIALNGNRTWYRWTSAGGPVPLGFLPGGSTDTLASGISADGAVIVGRGKNASGDNEAYRWTQAGGMVGLGDLLGGTFASVAAAASVDGSVVVGTGNGISGSEAFIWDALGGMQSLQNMLTSSGMNLGGFTQLTSASGVSADGLTVVGTGTNALGDTEGWIVTIPEPATLWLLAFGGLAAVRRRRGRAF